MIEDLTRIESDVNIQLRSGSDENRRDDLEKFLSAVSEMQEKLQLRDNSRLRIGNEIIITNDEPIYFFFKRIIKRQSRTSRVFLQLYKKLNEFRVIRRYEECSVLSE